MRALRVLLVGFVAFAFGPASVFALDKDATRSYKVNETAIGASATALPPDDYLVVPDAKYAFCVVETNSVRYSPSGTNPSIADDGILVTAGQSMEIVAADFKNIRFIRTAATSAAYITCDYRR